MVGNDVGVFVLDLDLGLGEHFIQELGEVVVEIDFVLARYRQRESFSFLRPQFQGEREFFRLFLVCCLPQSRRQQKEIERLYWEWLMACSN